LKQRIWILLVDGDAWSQVQFRNALPDVYEVVTAADQNDLRTRLADHAYDLCVLDPWQWIDGKWQLQSWLFYETLPKPVILLASTQDPIDEALLDKIGVEAQFVKSEGTYFALENTCQGILGEKQMHGQTLVQEQSIQGGPGSRETPVSRIFKATPGVSGLIDLDGRILAADDFMAAAFAKRPAEFVGLNIFDLLPPGLAESRRKAVKQVIETGKPVVLDDFNLGKYLRSHLHPIKDKNGIPIQIVLVVFDVTDQVHEAEVYRRRDEIFREVNFASEQFIQSSSWRDRIPEVLKRWGEATYVHRAFIYQYVIPTSGEGYYYLVSGWGRNPSTDELVLDRFQRLSLQAIGLSEIEKALFRGENVQLRVSSVSSDYLWLLEQNDAKALLHVPVFVGGRYWGFIGFVDCEVAREWSAVELDALKTSANILSAALKREQEETSHAALLEALPDLMFLFNRRGVYIDFHAQDPTLLAVPPDQFMGKSLEEVLPAHVAKIIRGALEKIFQTGTPQLFEYELQVHQSRYWEGSMVRSGDGAVAIIRDITRRRTSEMELRNSEKFIGDLSEITSSTTLNSDEKQNALLKMGCQRFGMENGYVLQLKRKELIFLHQYSSFEAAGGLTRLDLDQSFSREVVQQNRTIMVEDVIGTPFEHLVGYRDYQLRSYIGAPLMVGGKMFGVLSFASIHPRQTPFSQAEARFLYLMAQWIGLERDRTQYLAQLHQNSEDLLNKSLELEAARDQALELSRMKSDFLATMSHEIRTPMNAVIGMNELLLKTELDSQQRDYAETVRDAARLLLSLLNNTLDFSKIEAGKLRLEHIRFDPQKALEEVVAMFSQQAQQKKLEFNLFISPQIPHFLRGDPVRFSQVIINLVSNAIRFTQQGSVMVWSEVLTETDDAVELMVKVRDTGIGVPERMRERIFQPFVQADSEAAQSGGSGLGLAISKRLAEMLGGDLNYESVEGAGSVFWFTARFERDASRPVARTAKPALSWPVGEKLLLFEALPEAREIWERYLKSWEALYEVVDSPGQVIERLQHRLDDKHKYAGCILDYEGMRCMGGKTCAKVIDLLRATQTPVIMVTRQNARMRPQHNPPAEVFAGKLVRPFSRRDAELLLAGLFARNLAGAAPASQAGRSKLPPAKKEKPLFARLVLLAEDNPANQHLAEAQLQSLGYRAVTVPTGTQAVNELAQHYQDYGLVLMDLQMPEMDGYQATRLIRKAEGVINRHIPIIAMTASAMLEDRQQCLDAGMDDYISKPVLVDDIRRAITRCVAHEEALTTGTAAGPAQARQIEILDPRVVADLRSLNRPDEPDFYRQLVEIYLVDSRQVMQRIRSGVDSGDWAALQKAVHSLKGISANLGAGRLANLCGQIENQLRAGELLVNGWLEALEILFARTCEELKWESINKTETT
jgi:signal transduction histidine kinase/CheY-like chemotaxis protein/HPt (histidine-containing phosphotransfer) domain-containing protein